MEENRGAENKLPYFAYSDYLKEKYGEKVEQQLSVDIAATNLLTLLQKNHQPQYNNDYTVSPIYIQK